MCDREFPRSSQISSHMRTHTGEKPYQCTICEKRFSYCSSLRNHIKGVHEKLRPFKCKVCDQAFSKASYLLKHTAKKHELK